MDGEFVHQVFQSPCLQPHLLSSWHPDFYCHFRWKRFHFRFSDYCPHLDLTIFTVQAILLQKDGGQEKPLKF